MPHRQHAANEPTAKVYKETCANCGHDVTFDAAHIHRENPYFPFIEQKDMQDLKAEIRAFTVSMKDLHETIRTPDKGLVAVVRELNETLRAPKEGLVSLIKDLVGEFRRLIGEKPTPSDPKGSEA